MVSGGCVWREGRGALGLRNGMWADGRLGMTVPARIWQTVASSLPGGGCVRGCGCGCAWACVGMCARVCMGVHVCAWMCMDAHGCAWIHVLPVPAVPAPPHGVLLGDLRSPGAAGVLSPGHARLRQCHPAQGTGTPLPVPWGGGDEHGGHAPGDSQASLEGAREQEAAQCPQKHGCQDLARWEGWRLFWVRRSIAPSPTFTPSSFNALLPTQGPDKSGKGKGHPQPPLMGYL